MIIFKQNNYCPPRYQSAVHKTDEQHKFAPSVILSNVAAAN